MTTTPSRSVNDFDTKDDLNEALRSMNVYGSQCTTMSRDFRSFDASSFSCPAIIQDDSSWTMDETNNKDMDWVLKNYDKETTEPQSIHHELKRLECLKSYLILDANRESPFERITGMASRLFRTPIALVSLVDLGRQWFMSNRGLGDARETPRSMAFCAHAIYSKLDLLVVPDATLDDRFKDGPLVTGPPHIRFYAGAPLLAPEGYKLGTLCVISPEPRPQGLSLEEKHNLLELAAMVVDVMVERRAKQRQLREKPAQLLASTAHELLNPLMGIELSLSLLQNDESLPLTTHQRELLETATNCTSIMTRICNDTVHSYSRDNNSSSSSSSLLQDSNSTLDNTKKPLNIRHFVKSLNTIMEPFPKTVALVIAVDPAVPDEIVSDELKIFRSAIHFLTNACSHTQTGSVRLRIFPTHQSKHLRFECEDTGPGIPVQDYPNLFRPPRDGRKVAGLGLCAVAKHISELGGDYGFRPRGIRDDGSPVIGADGDLQTGSIFWFSIPLLVPADTSGIRTTHDMLHDSVSSFVQEQKLGIGSAANRNPAVVPGLRHDFAQDSMVDKRRDLDEDYDEMKSLSDDDEKRKKRALVIEDSLVVRKSVSRALQSLGFDVTQTVNGMEGLEALQENIFDVTLCDFLMPVMDGLDCVQQYREWEQTHRPWFRQFIVGMSAHAGPADAEKGISIGMDDFQPKPVTLKKLSALIETNEFKSAQGVLDKLDLNASQQARSFVPKRRKKVYDTRTALECTRTCLIAQGPHKFPNPVLQFIESKGWKAVVVDDGEDALRLLKVRNWGAVLLDEDLPLLRTGQCVCRFREWEKENRVNRQKNIVLLSADVVPSTVDDRTSTVQLPSGFDVVLGKPVVSKELHFLLEQADTGDECHGGNDIVFHEPIAA